MWRRRLAAKQYVTPKQFKANITIPVLRRMDTLSGKYVKIVLSLSERSYLYKQIICSQRDQIRSLLE